MAGVQFNSFSCPTCPTSVQWHIFLIIYSTKTASRKPERRVAKLLSKKQRNKQMSGCMIMYGIKCQPHNTAYAKANGLCCTLAPCLYNIDTSVNSQLEHLWQQHLREFSNLERLHVPACAEQRKTITDGVDPGKSYRISRLCDAFACSMSKNFTIGPH